ncbi:hypothetical protein DPMN_012121 [Dreissena polymorpha]|uniref:Uncharacterized protein n=1 Tax=Dreissena polymorpha TaxID=45954 RepID=A0A9D4N4Y1_DREPO|nr:hypothetical protein DPMN_012121 [Dreissena polymorpha]
MCPVPCADGVVLIMWSVLYLVVYWYVIVVHLSGAEEEEFVGCLRTSVSRGRLYLVPVPRAQSKPPPLEHTHAERARPPPPPRPHIAPAEPPSRWSLLRQAPSSTLLLRATTVEFRAGYRKRPDSRGAPGSFKCPVYSTDTLRPPFNVH